MDKFEMKSIINNHLSELLKLNNDSEKQEKNLNIARAIFELIQCVNDLERGTVVIIEKIIKDEEDNILFDSPIGVCSTEHEALDNCCKRRDSLIKNEHKLWKAVDTWVDEDLYCVKLQNRLDGHYRTCIYTPTLTTNINLADTDNEHISLLHQLGY